MKAQNRYQQVGYLKAKSEAFERTQGLCAFCGMHPATDAHHWGVVYPPVGQEVASDLTPLCERCHFLATSLRWFVRNWGEVSIHQMRKAIQLLFKLLEFAEFRPKLPSNPPSTKPLGEDGGGHGQAGYEHEHEPKSIIPEEK